MTDTLKLLGKLVDGHPPRDAIHIAVVPVEAEHCLLPGTRVGIRDKRASSAVDKTVGIVDPFLPDRVEAGQRFWLYLYPGTVTSLIHHWEHPAFPTVVESAASALIVEYLHKKNQQLEAEQKTP